MAQITDFEQFKREKARRANGQFGAQEHTPAEVTLKPLPSATPALHALPAYDPDEDFETASSELHKYLHPAEDDDTIEEPEAPTEDVPEPAPAADPWKDLPTTYVSLKETNKLIRRDLRDAFPGVKFSVVGDSYAGGSSTDIRWTDGPRKDEVDEITRKYSTAVHHLHEDYWGSRDSNEFDADGNPVKYHYGASFVHGRREFSEETKAEAEEFLDQALAAEGLEKDEHVRYKDIPQEFYRRATVENGMRTGHDGSMFAFRGWDTSVYELRNYAQEMIANERYNAQRQNAAK